MVINFSLTPLYLDISSITDKYVKQTLARDHSKIKWSHEISVSWIFVKFCWFLYFPSDAVTDILEHFPLLHSLYQLQLTESVDTWITNAYGRNILKRKAEMGPLLMPANGRS